MSINTLACIEVTCDDCGSDCWTDADDPGTPHFTSAKEATERLSGDYGWTITEGEQICQRCATQRLCKTEGHDWSDWRNGVRSFAGTQHRYCDRESCGGFEERPIPSKFPKVDR